MHRGNQTPGAVGFPWLERALERRIRDDEARAFRNQAPPGSLWDHVCRVAALAERFAPSEGLSPLAGRLAGLFHDAGKFCRPISLDHNAPEEAGSAAVLREFAQVHAIDPTLVDEVEQAIVRLYRDDLDPSALSRVLFDADTLDKLGPLGVATFFAKAGLRGEGISRDLLHRTTVELTYAHHAPQMLWTAAGQALAARRAPATRRYFMDLFDALREDGLADFRIERLAYDGLTLVVAAPAACACGGAWQREITQTPAVNRTSIRVQHRCPVCGDTLRLRFSRPRLVSLDEVREDD